MKVYCSEVDVIRETNGCRTRRGGWLLGDVCVQGYMRLEVN